MQISKYFRFKEFPFYAVKNVDFNGIEWLHNFGQIPQILDLDNLSKPLWITKKLICSYFPQNSKELSNLLSKVVVCDINYLEIENQILTFEEFKFLSARKNITTFEFSFSQIEYGNGEIMSMDELIKCLPKIKNFYL
uniref:Uncharacterized protein n=1 Tax=Panagrolaimus sp. ES5 TaxID=591445 RepID=A0AC34FNU9_9BILA